MRLLMGEKGPAELLNLVFLRQRRIGYSVVGRVSVLKPIERPSIALRYQDVEVPPVTKAEHRPILGNELCKKIKGMSVVGRIDGRAAIAGYVQLGWPARGQGNCAGGFTGQDGRVDEALQ